MESAAHVILLAVTRAGHCNRRKPIIKDRRKQSCVATPSSPGQSNALDQQAAHRGNHIECAHEVPHIHAQGGEAIGEAEIVSLTHRSAIADAWGLNRDRDESIQSLRDAETLRPLGITPVAPSIRGIDDRGMWAIRRRSVDRNRHNHAWLRLEDPPLRRKSIVLSTIEFAEMQVRSRRKWLQAEALSNLHRVRSNQLGAGSLSASSIEQFSDIGDIEGHKGL
jgi:hypothetical protein